METGKKDGFNPEIIHLVMEEFSQDIKVNTQTLNDLIAAVNGTNSKLDDIKSAIQKTASGNSIAPDLLGKINSISNVVNCTKIMLGERPAPVIQKKQFLLFPEYDAGRFYKIVFGRWFLMLIILYFLSCLYQWAIHYSDNAKSIQIEQLRNEHIQKSWDYLYDNNGREIKSLMEKAYDHARQRDSQ
jgi:hypothetical protein